MELSFVTILTYFLLLGTIGVQLQGRFDSLDSKIQLQGEELASKIDALNSHFDFDAQQSRLERETSE
jgi:hypothetical protein